MQCWSLLPKYIDTKELFALWREALLVRKYEKEKLTNTKIIPSQIDLNNIKDSF
jgi:hypothetical protein